MIGYQLVVGWLITFFAISYLLCKYLNLNSPLLITIFIWSFLMLFIFIFEMLILVYYKYLEQKGKHYYETNTCYWNDSSVKLLDCFTGIMYMDLYADYSLSDKRYCESTVNEGFRFVATGEVIHGIFCFIMSSIILYFYFFNFNEVYIYLSAIIYSAIQFALITWYLSSTFLEMFFCKNDKFWFPPLLWNVPWIIIPLYIIYESIKILLDKCIIKPKD